ncbi:MAG: ABC transporter permease [Armatimonadota bacterium]|jgi:phospholipid/cholesterol/gamma-HCH transport system permease protein
MVGALGRQAIAAVAFVGDQVLLLTSATGYIARGRLGLRRTMDQMAIAGTDSLPIVVVTLLFVGMAWGFNTVHYLVQFGAISYYGGSTSIAIARELGPALCGVVVAARIGSAYAAQLGTMVVTEQVDALHALAVNPIYYLVVPRLVACVLMLPVLTVVADVTGIFGAFIISVNQGISSGVYISSIQQWMSANDLYGGIAKGFVFGAIIALVGCRQGLRTTGGAEGVGRAATSSVVLSIVLIYIANLLLTVFLFGGPAT